MSVDDTGAALSPKEPLQSAIAALGLSVTAGFVPWSQSRNKDRSAPSLNWRVTLKRHGREILTTDYMAGMAHCPSYKQNVRRTFACDAAIKHECEKGRSAPHAGIGGKVILPDICDVVHSLVLDADAIDFAGYKAWASDSGYDADSREGERIYRACLEIALKFRASIGDHGLAKLRDASQDY